MIETCSTLPPGAGFISSVTAYVDCQAQTLGSGAWSALSAPGSSLMIVLTGFLTITIALIGYNLLLGSALTVRDATLAFVKIGAVFALATSWPAYRTLVYDLVVDGPGQLVREIGPGSGAVGADGTLLQRLDLADRNLEQLAILGAGYPAMGQMNAVAPPPFVGFDAFALGGSRILFSLTAIAALTAVRVVAGLMLALGPFFIGFLMFDATRSLFEGWIRILAGAALASVGAGIALGLELALLEPWLSDALTRRMGNEPLPQMPTELFILTCLFSIITGAALYGCARAAGAFRLPMIARSGSIAGRHSRAVAPDGSVSRTARAAAASAQERTRAAAVANILAASSRRDMTVVALATNDSSSTAQTPQMRARAGEAQRTAVPLGRSFSRRTTSRHSARAGKRDLSA